MTNLSNHIIVPYLEVFSFSPDLSSLHKLNPYEGNYLKEIAGFIPARVNETPIQVYEIGSGKPLLLRFGLLLADVSENDGQPVELNSVVAHVCELPLKGMPNSLFTWHHPVPENEMEQDNREPSELPIAREGEPVYVEPLPVSSLFQFAGSEAVLKPEDFTDRSAMRSALSFCMYGTKGDETLLQVMFHSIHAIPPARNDLKFIGLPNGVDYGREQIPFRNQISRVKFVIA